MTFKKLNPSANGKITFEITPERSENVYVYIKSSKMDAATVTSNLFTKTINTADGYIADLGLRSAGETITVEMPVKSTDVNLTQNPSK